MQDSLARKIEEPNIKLYDGPNKPEFKVHINPHAKRVEEINDTIDALLDIRLSLSVKKIISPIIKKSELLEIVNNVKDKTIDERVNEEIDKLFEEYLSRENENSVAVAKVEAKINNGLSLEELENLSGDNYEDKGNEKGVSLVKRDGHFNSAHEIPKE